MPTAQLRREIERLERLVRDTRGDSAPAAPIHELLAEHGFEEPEPTSGERLDSYCKRLSSDSLKWLMGQKDQGAPHAGTGR